jgi:hypothetical protein
LAYESWQHALNVLASGIELNRVICERSIGLEIELKYKYAHCVRELFVTRQIGTLTDVLDAYNATLNLIHHSYHDLNLVKNCFLELAVAFISTYDPEILVNNAIGGRPTILENSMENFTTPSSSIVSSAVGNARTRKNNVQTARAIDAALICLAMAVKTSNAIKEKTLLPGHDDIKNMANINATSCPTFIANDLLAYYVFADRRRVYRDEIEAEVLILAPEFDTKESHQSYDDKVKKLAAESDSSITWIHLLNYQTKLQNLSSMRNLNTLKNGKNRYKYSEFLTIGYTPILKSTTHIAARLAALHNYFKSNLGIYESDCMSPITNTLMEFVKINARKVIAAGPSAKTPTFKSLLENVKYFNGNLSSMLTNSTDPIVANSINKEGENEEEASRQAMDWSYLQLWPACYDFTGTPTTQAVTLVEPSVEVYVEYMVTFNWCKNLIANDLLDTQDEIVAIIAVKDSLTKNKVKYKTLSAEKVNNVHKK